MKKLSWTQNEDEIVSELVVTFSSKKWKRLSEALRQQGYSRTQGECRERWVNYLDPRITSSGWSKAQLTQLYALHEQMGTKWAEIHRAMGRSQNMLKNRFYGTIRNYLRCVLTTLGPKPYHTTIEISKLSPKWLHDFYSGTGDFRFMGLEVKEAIKEMGFRVDKIHLSALLLEKKEMYQEVKRITLGEFKNHHNIEKRQVGRLKSMKPQPFGKEKNGNQERQPDKEQAVKKQPKSECDPSTLEVKEGVMPTIQYSPNFQCCSMTSPYTLGGYAFDAFSRVSFAWPWGWQL